MGEPVAELDSRFSEPGAVATPWDEGGAALVFEVAAVKVIAFAKGSFAQTRYRFPGAG